MSKVTKEGNFLCLYSTEEEYIEELEKRKQRFQEEVDEWSRKKESDKFLGLNQEEEQQSENQNFSEEEFGHADERLVRWTLEELNRMNGIPNENELTEEEIKDIFSKYEEEPSNRFYFSEEQENADMENWKKSEIEKIKSLETADERWRKKRDKSRGNK